MSLTTVKEGKEKREKIVSPNQSRPNKELFCVKALYDYPGYEEGELALTTGQIVKVYDNTTFHDWWKGMINEKVGIFPSNYVQMIQDEPSDTRATTGSAHGADQSDEGFVMANADRLVKFQQIAANFDSRASVTENGELQEHYSQILAMRPRILKLLHNIHNKAGNFPILIIDELVYVNNRYNAALGIYQRLMDSYAHEKSIMNNLIIGMNNYARQPQVNDYQNAYYSNYAQQPPYDQGQYANYRAFPAQGQPLDSYYPPQNQGGPAN